MECPSHLRIGTVTTEQPRRFETDFAQAVCIAQSAVTADQVEYGLGYPITILTPNDETMFLKVWRSRFCILERKLTVGARIREQPPLYRLATVAQGRAIPPLTGGNVSEAQLLGTYDRLAGMFSFLFAAAFGCNSPFWKLRGNQCIDQMRRKTRPADISH